MQKRLFLHTVLALSASAGLATAHTQAHAATPLKFQLDWRFEGPAAFFLQPVPAIDKELTEEEKRVVGPMAYRDLYKRITAGMMTLRDRGLAVYNLADVFADQKGTIYADDIHVVRALDGESLGNNILAARIAELLAETWGLQKKPQ